MNASHIIITVKNGCVIEAVNCSQNSLITYEVLDLDANNLEEIKKAEPVDADSYLKENNFE